jgi:hypothetical protein
MKSFKLFDRRWRVEMVAYKLGITNATARHYFDEWAKERKDREAAERELVKRCLEKHIGILEDQRMWTSYRYGRSEQEAVDKLAKEIEDCRRLLIFPERITRENKEFLIGEYSSRIQSQSLLNQITKD